MKFLEKLNKIRSHPATKESMQQLKPKKTLWSLAGVALFFIVPEIVAFIWGDAITAWAQMHLAQPLPLEEEYKYKAIEMLFGDPSYLNLLIGIALFIWAFF